MESKRDVYLARLMKLKNKTTRLPFCAVGGLPAVKSMCPPQTQTAP